MYIPKIDSNSLMIFSGYNHPLKKAFKKGLLPNVRNGIYGNPINKNNVSLEHGQPVSQGGLTELSNLFLAEKDANSKRGVKPIEDFLTREMLVKYLAQFVGVKNYLINGAKYINAIIDRWWDKLS